MSSNVDKSQTRLFLALGVGGALLALVAALVVVNYAGLGVAALRRAKTAAPGDGVPRVLVAVDPIAYFVERVGGERVVVSTLTPPGKDPESFSPTPADLKAVASTTVFLRVGLPVEERFAGNIESIAPNASVVDLRDGLPFVASEHKHSDGDETETEDEAESETAAPTADSDADADESGEIDPHLWTSPELAKTLVEKIRAALTDASPENADYFAERAAATTAELTALQTEVVERLKPFAGRTFVVFHPAYGRFANEFGLTQRAVESEGKAPRPRELAALLETVKAERVAALIVQPEFNRAAAQTVADSVGATLIEHSPLEKDYFDQIRALTSAIETALGPGDAAAPESNGEPRTVAPESTAPNAQN